MNSKIKFLVQKYEDNIQHYQKSSYSEAQLRLDFIDPFFSILEWDINNTKGNLASEREVLVEEILRDGASTHGKKPDYTFRLFSERKFFVEAKKPSINVVEGAEEAKQIRRYGFTAKLPISVLTNFEYLIIYDCSMPVTESDSANHSVIAKYHYTEYSEKLDEILLRLGRESVYNGVFDDEWKEIGDKIQKRNVNTLFLMQINEWRKCLAENFIAIKSNMSEELLNNMVQAYLNSIIFLRVCEDRGLETPFTLLGLAKNHNHKKLILKLKDADRRYNAGLFDLLFADELIHDEKSYLWKIIEQLYYPESPFSFSVLPSDILGQIYEIFLGSKVHIDSGVLSIIPKNVDRDIVTTPTFIIKEIIENTVVKYCEKLSIEQILNSKFSDIACGSGAFLLEVFETLQDKVTQKYLSEGDMSKLEIVSRDRYKLKYQVKQQILTSCIYGIDRDYNATKATQFGLLLKLLENETENSITSPALPSLDENILFGNSLVDPSYIEEESIEVLQNINPFSFIGLSFDVIVGNPPYLSTEHIISSTSKEEVNIYKDQYSVVNKQYDKYYLFIERAIQLLNPNGYLGYIVPSKFIKLDSAKNLRRLLAEDNFLKSIVYFGRHQVFDDKTTYTAILFGIKNKQPDGFIFYEALDLKKWKLKEHDRIMEVAKEESKHTSCKEDSKYILEMAEQSARKIFCGFIHNRDVLDDDIWNLRAQDIWYVSDLYSRGTSLETIVGRGNVGNGIQTSATDDYIHKPIKEENNLVFFEYKGKEYGVEKELTRPYYDTKYQEPSDSFYTYQDVKPNSFVIYPYRNNGTKVQLVDIQDLKINYPFLYSYLQDIKHILNHPKRSVKPDPKTDDEWYRYGRHQALENCDVEQKIIVGVLSQGYKYSIDNKRTFISSGGTAGYCYINVPDSSNYSIYYIQAVINSKYLEKFAFIRGSIFRGGYISRGTSILKTMPIPTIDFENNETKKLHDDIADVQKQMNEIYGLMINLEHQPIKQKPLERKFKSLDKQMKIKLKQLFNFRQDEAILEIEELYS